MNIVDLIKDQMSGDLMGSLGSMLGKDQATATKAATGAVPALLSVLAGLAKSPGGIEKLITALRTFDTRTLADVVSSLRTGNAAPVQQKGGDLLSSLLGGGTLAMVVSALSKFSNLDAGSSKSLLSTLLPLILGVISSHFKGKTIDSHSVTDFFKGQASNISAAMPAGLSLPEIPGASELKAAAPGPRRAFPVGCSRWSAWPCWGYSDGTFTRKVRRKSPSRSQNPFPVRRLLPSRSTCPRSRPIPPWSTCRTSSPGFILRRSST